MDTGPARHEGGTPAALGAFALAAAVRALEDEGWDELVAHEEALLERLLTGLDAIDGVRTYELWGRGHDRVGVVSFNLAGLNPALLAAALAAEHGIGVRDGAFCAHPLMDHFGALRAVRASIGVGTSPDDIDRLLGAVAQIARDGVAWTYVGERRLRPARPRPASPPFARRPAQRAARGRGIGLPRLVVRLDSARSSPAPSRSTSGRGRSSHLGSHQAR